LDDPQKMGAQIYLFIFFFFFFSYVSADA